MQLTDSDFYRLRDFMYQNFGINLSQKRTLIEGRLSNLLSQKGYSSFTQYVDNLLKLKSDEEISFLVSKLTTNFTYFLREEQHFEYMTQVVLPEVLSSIKDKNLSIWSAGCSSGEEPYTIAMFLDHYFKGNKRGIDTRILATDISENVLKKAQNGIYDVERMSRLPEAWIKKYFIKLDDQRYQVTPEIKKEVIFRKFNLMEAEFRFKRRFDLIFCRNVMIYFDTEVRRQVVGRFHKSLADNRYLFIGLSENLVNNEASFKYMRPSIYKK